MTLEYIRSGRGGEVRVTRWRVISRSLHPSMVGRVGRTIGGYSAAVWADGSWWHWQIWERKSGRPVSGGLQTTERKAKLMASAVLKEQALGE